MNQGVRYACVVLHGLLTIVTAPEVFVTVLNGLLATMVLSVSVDASVFSENRCTGAEGSRCSKISPVRTDPPSPSKNAYRLAEHLESEYRVSNERVHVVFCKCADACNVISQHRWLHNCHHPKSLITNIAISRIDELGTRDCVEKLTVAILLHARGTCL